MAVLVPILATRQKNFVALSMDFPRYFLMDILFYSHLFLFLLYRINRTDDMFVLINLCVVICSVFAGGKMKGRWKCVEVMNMLSTC